ncbi:MAG: hypothetical protein MZV65_21020 [Chromatiales bacterium]|nr:hypothetical protein [Chromatiales bacterium]
MAKVEQESPSPYASSWFRVEAYPVEEALEAILKNASKVKFTESVDVAIRLGVDPRKSEQERPWLHGAAKRDRQASSGRCFAHRAKMLKKAKAAGADVVGMDDLHDRMKEGDLNFDVVIATPDAMRVVGKLGQLLGPRGLMPNPKVGTVSTDVETAVRNAKAAAACQVPHG